MASRMSLGIINIIKPIFNDGRVHCPCSLFNKHFLFKSYSMWESERRGEYAQKTREPSLKLAQDGAKVLKGEIKKWTQEKRENIGLPFHKLMHNVQHSDYEVVYNFNNEEAIKEWTVITDKKFKQGKSEAEFVLGPQKHGAFRGMLCSDTVKDGVVKYSGYAGIRSPYAMKSFFRHKPHDWRRYTHLLIRCRGDGRPYQLSLGMDRYFDVQWHDQFNFPLYTHGGPYWQLAKIPFRKFFLSHKGRVQDKQEMPDLDRVLFLTITQCDGFSGPFELEIDFIGVYYDASNMKIHEYELYEVDPYELH